jgi:RimJ/RimL family protein N-acetyltransferase
VHGVLGSPVLAGRSELYAIEIGWTWLAASAQRTGINVEAKLLLLEYAFETLGVVRVDLKTPSRPDARNERSRRPIERLGVQFEGVLRHWSQSHAPREARLLRDSTMFSVIVSEWPTTKATLCRRLAQASNREIAMK